MWRPLLRRIGLVTGLGVAVLILGIRIQRADSQEGGIGQ